MHCNNTEEMTAHDYLPSHEVTSLADRTPAPSHNEVLLLLHQASLQRKFAEQRLAAHKERIEELEKLISTDPLTGLLNRRGFESFFKQELGRAYRYNTPGSVLILLDVDGLKKINDTYGHQAGDACLIKVASYLQNKIRSVDAVARIGDNKFAVLLSHTDLERSINCLDEIKRALRGLRAVWQEKVIPVRASLGVSYVPATGTYETACSAADKALCTNKNR